MFSNLWILGHSYLDSNGVALAGANSAGSRLQAAFGLANGQTFDRAVSGSVVRWSDGSGCSYATVLQDLNPGVTAWPRQAIVGVGFTMWGTNDAVLGSDGTWASSFISSYEAVIARLIAGAVYEDDDPTMEYDGTWTTVPYADEATASNPASGSGFTYSSTVDAANDASVTWRTPSDFAIGQASGAIDIGFIGGYAGAEAKIFVDDVEDQTVVTHGLLPAGFADDTVGVVARIAGLSPGEHTIKVKIDTTVNGGSLKFDYISIEAPEPPLLLVSKMVQSSDPQAPWTRLADPTIHDRYNSFLIDIAAFFDDPNWLRVVDSDTLLGGHTWEDDGSEQAVVQTQAEWIVDATVYSALTPLLESDTGTMRLADGTNPYLELPAPRMVDVEAAIDTGGATPAVVQTSTAWASDSTVYAAGRFLGESDTGKYKFGDGSQAYSALAYSSMTVLGPHLDALAFGVQHVWQPGINEQWFATDGLHPNPEGAKLIGQVGFYAAIGALLDGVPYATGLGSSPGETAPAEPGVWTTDPLGNPIGVLDDFEEPATLGPLGTPWDQLGGVFGIDGDGQAYTSSNKFAAPGFVDAFDRADSNTTLGSDWTVPDTGVVWGIADEEAKLQSNSGSRNPLPVAVAPDLGSTAQWAEFVVGTRESIAQSVGLALRFSANTTGDNFVAIVTNGVFGGFYVIEVVDGVIEQTSSLISLPTGDGYTLHAEVGFSGSANRVYVWTAVNGAWGTPQTYDIIESELQAAGSGTAVGLACGASTTSAARWGPFRAGTPTSTLAPTSAANITAQDLGYSNGVVSYRVGSNATGENGTKAGLWVRGVDERNGYRLGAWLDGTLGRVWLLEKCVDGTFTTVGMFPGVTRPGTLVALQMIDDTFTCFVNNSLVETEDPVTDDTFLDGTIHGIAQPFGTVVGTFADFRAGRAYVADPKTGSMHVDSSPLADGQLDLYGPYNATTGSWAGPLELPVTPSDPSKPDDALAQTLPRIGTSIANLGSALASGTLCVWAVELFANQTVSAATFLSGTTALASATHQWAILLDGDRQALAVSADDTTGAWAANAPKTFSYAEPYRVTTSGLYYVGLMVAATTVPSLLGIADAQTAVSALPPMTAATADTSQTTPPTLPFTAADFTVKAQHVYAYLS